jgi:hypothetical protein
MDKLQGLLLGFLALRSIIASPRTFLRMVVKERRRSKSFRSQLRNGWKIVGPPALVSIILMQANLRLRA